MTELRRVLWIAGTPARAGLLGAIWIYRVALSGAFGGGQCRFSPGCSRYAVEAIRTHGAIRGTGLAIRRVMRCNPFGKSGLDPVPPPTRSYDTILRRDAG